MKNATIGAVYHNGLHFQLQFLGFSGLFLIVFTCFGVIYS